MKVLHICKYYYPYKGGMETHVFNLCNKLKEKKIDLEVLAFNDSFKSKLDFVKDIPVMRVATLGNIFSTPLSLTYPFYLPKKIFDIYHIHLPNPVGNFFAVLKNMKNVCVTYHSESAKYGKIFKIYKPFLMELLEKVKRIIVSSPVDVENSEILTKFKNKCVVIPHGIELKKFEKRN